MTGASKGDQGVTATRGARWIAAAMVGVGLSNYGYALMLTHLLNVSEYSRFAGGQGLILWATNVASVSVPWVLAQTLVRAQSDAERDSAIRFAKLTSAGSGLVAAFVVGIIAIRFGNSAAALAVALSTFILFLGTTTTGWLQGYERMRALSVLFMVENLLKNGAGIILVVVAGLGDTGALAAFGIGALAMLAWWPRTPRGTGEQRLAGLANRDLWRRAGAVAGAQGLVSLFMMVDVVLVALLPANRALAASYQASATLARIPLYIASAVGIAFFPSLARQSGGGVIVARAIRMYTAVALPLAAVIATSPASVLAIVFPTQYSSVSAILKYTALTGLAAGGISLATAFFQAADDYSFMRWLGAGVAGYAAALLVGWRIDGIIGLAAGGAISAFVVMIFMSYRLVHRHGLVVLAWVRLIEPGVVTAALVLLRPYQFLWMAVASLVGLHAAVLFLRPVARHARIPRWAALHDPRTERPSSPISLLTDTLWRETAPPATQAEICDALTLGRLNRVEGLLANAYPTEFADVLSEVRNATQLYTNSLRQAVERLYHAGIPAVLIEGGPRAGHVRTNVDLVIPKQHWHRALNALPDGGMYSAKYQLDHSATAFLYPSAGPGVHLHTDLAWLGVPFLSTSRLLARARRDRHGVLVPMAADYLRIWLGHALFQSRALDLSQLLVVRNLMRPEVISAARAEAGREGWLRGLDDVLALTEHAIGLLDQGLPITLPVPLSAPQTQRRKSDVQPLAPHAVVDSITRNGQDRRGLMVS